MTTYTISEIKKAEKDYLGRRVLRFLKGGKWETVDLDGKGIPHIDAIRAEQVELRKTMTFSEFLETKWQRK